MIVDFLENANRYFGIGNRHLAALRYLQESNFFSLAPGRYDIDGDHVYAMVQKYTTKPAGDGLLEAHRKYIDVQYVVAGEECIGVEFKTDQMEVRPYNEQEDYALYQGNPLFLRLSPGMFSILYPNDLHVPRIISGKEMEVLKVVVKVRI